MQSISEEVRSQGVSAGLADRSLDDLDSQLHQALDPLVHRGRELRALGSRLHVERQIDGPGYLVTIIFRVGERPSLFSRIIRRLGIR